MSKLALNAIATRALLDNEFRAAILNGHRKERISDFNLSVEDFNAVMSIEAADVGQFVRRLGRYMQTSRAAI